METGHRFYRDWVQSALPWRFSIVEAESDLLVVCDAPLEGLAREALAAARATLRSWIERDELFGASLLPHHVPTEAPGIVGRMAAAGATFGVGPMAAVAGAVAAEVGRAMLRGGAGAVVVENGGDIFARTSEPLRLALWAGDGSPFAGRLVFEIDARAGIGIATSSGRVGPSLSFGRADAVAALHPDAAFADAAATALANEVQGPDDVATIVERERARGRLAGLVVACGDRLGLFGELTLVGG